MPASVRYEHVELGTETASRNAEGFEIKEWSWTQVPAERRSVGRAEYYAAVGVGYKPQRIYRLRSCAYEDQTQLRDAGGKLFKILRTYDTGDYTELTCERLF